MKKHLSRFATLVLVFAAAPRADAQVYRDHLVQAPSLAPPSRGSVAGALGSFALGAGELARGTFTLPSPFEAPSERGAPLIDPFPQYSADRGLSEWGMGWGVELTIRRHRSVGEPDYSAGDDFLSPWGRLIAGDDGNYYAAGLSSSVVARQVDGGWRVVDSAGTEHVFRAGDAFTTGRGTYAWWLSEVRTPSGDSLTISYWRNASNRPFVSFVRYARAGAAKPVLVQLNYESVPVPTIDYRPGEAMVLDHRVDTVVVRVGAAGFPPIQTRYRYELGYDGGRGGAAFYLTSVVRRFAPTFEAEPPMTFTYDIAEDGYASADMYGVPELDDLLNSAGAGAIEPEFSAFLDIDEDGRPDVERGSDQTLFRQTYAGWTAESLPGPTGSENPQCRPAPSIANPPRLLSKMTADAVEPNVITTLLGGANTTVTICDRTGLQLTAVALPGNWEIGPNTRLVDLDRDLAPELVQVSAGAVQVARNVSGGSSHAFAIEPAQPLAPAFAPIATWVQDVNGDTIADLVGRHANGIVVWYGRGYRSFEMDGVELLLYPETGSSPIDVSGYEIVFLDANNDGLTDVLLAFDRFLTLYTNRGDHLREVPVSGFWQIQSAVGLPIAMDLEGLGEEQVVFTAGLQAYAVTITRPSAGLMTEAADGRGNTTRFSYQRSRATPGIERRPPMLVTMERDVAMTDATVHTYDYESPRFHSEGRFLLGFELVSHTGGGAIEEAHFHHDDDISGELTELSIVADDSPGLERLTTLEYEEAFWHGVRFHRVIRSAGAWRSGSTTLPGTIVDYGNYQRGTCATEVTQEGPHGEVVTTTILASPSGLAALGAQHCLAARIEQVGTHTAHPDRNFDYVAELARNDLGQIVSITALGAGESLVAQTVVYDAFGRLESVTRPGAGATQVEYDPNTGAVQRVIAPDGVIGEVGRRHPVTDAIQILVEDRDGIRRRGFLYDGLERLAGIWDDANGTSESEPAVRLDYRYASDRDHPGVVETYTLVDLASGAMAEKHDLFAGNGAGVGTMTPIDGVLWAFSGVSSSDADGILSRTYWQAPAKHPSSSIDRSLLFSGEQLGYSRRSAFGHVVEEERLLQAGVTAVGATTLSLSPDGTRVMRARSNGETVFVDRLDADGRVLQSIESATGSGPSFEYDALGRLVRVVLADGVTEQRVELDAFGRSHSVVHSGVGRVELAYAPVTGRVAAKRLIDDAGNMYRDVSFEYDAIGRPVSELHRRTSDGAEMEYRFEYDGAGLPSTAHQRGRLNVVTGPHHTRRTAFAADGALVREELEIGGWRTIENHHTYMTDGSPRSTTRIVRDQLGAVLSEVTQETEYDSWGRVARVLLDGGVMYELSYDDHGRVAQVAFADGDEIIPIYDPDTRAQRGYEHATGDWTLSFDVQLDSIGRTAAESVTMWTPGAPALSHDRAYQYDERGWLLNASGPDGNESYGYGDAGLISSVTDASGPRGTTRSGATLVSGGVTYTYDDAGRVIARGDLSLVYGPSGMVEQATRAGVTVEYAYDERGQRLLRLEGGVPVAAYAGSGYLTETSIIEPVRVAGRSIGLLIDGVFHRRATDPRGTVLAESDGTWRAASAYGLRGAHPDLSEVLDWVEQGYDAHLGTIRMGVRDYDPYIAQFLTPDPLISQSIELCAERPTECTLYGYAANDPIQRTDPSGMKTCKNCPKDQHNVYPEPGTRFSTSHEVNQQLDQLLLNWNATEEYVASLTPTADQRAHWWKNRFAMLPSFSCSSGAVECGVWNAQWKIPDTLGGEYELVGGVGYDRYVLDERARIGPAQRAELTKWLDTADSGGVSDAVKFLGNGVTVELVGLHVIYKAPAAYVTSLQFGGGGSSQAQSSKSSSWQGSVGWTGEGGGTGPEGSYTWGESEGTDVQGGGTVTSVGGVTRRGHEYVAVFTIRISYTDPDNGRLFVRTTTFSSGGVSPLGFRR